MRIIFLTFLLIAFLPFSCFGQSLPQDVGARSKGVGNSNSNFTDEWSIFNNVGGISGVRNGVVFFGYDRYFEIDGFDRLAAGVIQPFKFGNVGFSVYKFGDELYSEQIISGAFGNKIGFVRLGLKVNYYQMRVNEFSTTQSLYFDFGGIVELIPELSFGAFISNFTLSHLDNSEKTKLPTLMKVGLSYQPAEDISFNMDLYKDVDYEPVIRMGLEYCLNEKFYIRTGLNTSPLKGFFGAGIELNRFCIDYAVSTNRYLGTSHNASISYRYQK